jgi:exportin-1
MTSKIPNILEYVFESTLNMINKDFHNFPDHRIAFFKLIQAINLHCFPALVELPPAQFKFVVDSIVWAFKHTVRDIADTGLTICLELLTNMSKADASVSNKFYQAHFLRLLQDILYVITDTSHKSGFKLQSSILAHMYLQINQINVPIYDVAKITNTNNAGFLKDYTINLLANAFPNVNRIQIETFTMGLFDLNKDITHFKLHVRDFLISLKEFSGNNQDLYREEYELEQQRKLEVERMVPGLINPHEMED